MTLTSSHGATAPRTPPIVKGVLYRAAAMSFAASLILGVTGFWQQVMPWLLILTIFRWAGPLMSWDMRHKLLPNAYTVPLAVALAGLSAGLLVTDPILNLTGTATTGATAHGATMLITALAITSVLFALALFAPIGMGDVKLLAGLSAATAYYGPEAGIISLFLGHVLALPIAYIAQRKGEKTVPMGPFLITAALLVLLFMPVRTLFF
ncbi:prepilin peptidase [Rothia mucilaginosa]|uniref:prepilin peptidase n=1 Tax=Rothia mucilaginosa TaxID=43675 RepID=UPI0028E9D4BA|nr:prepilin peptidase [Rothia mucilaginosa]